jgi:hypothetical protein
VIRGRPVDWRWLVGVAVALNLAISVAWVATFLLTGDNLVRLRNSLGARIGEASDFTWLPSDPPAGFLTAGHAVPGSLVAAANSAGSRIRDDDDSGAFAVGVALSQDLMRAPKRVDGPVNATSEATYLAIVEQGRGYCGDFVKAFTALSLASGIPVRQWGFAFDGFGSGHTFNEVYDPTLRKWVMIDSFHSLYFVDPVSRMPLSTLEVHDRLLAIGESPQGIEVVRIVPERVPFRTDDLAVDYYRRGMSQLWLVWGSNVFDYEASFAGRVEAGVHRSVGQLIGILTDQYPAIRVYPVGMSRRDFRALMDARREFLLAAAFLGASFLFAVFVAVQLRRSARAFR